MAESPYGFAVVCAIAFVLSIGSAYFLWKRHMF
jgi:hypothetical protein